ncbi:MAG: hypothetical protein RLZZ385_1122 [Pseudomonadota bacterium]|jgi:tRNA-(ms[2]io[6]A)-hydroxylase
MDTEAALDEIRAFLTCATPEAWFEAALANQPELLIDHANCEKKAAATAMNLMYRHIEHPRLLVTMARLAREELLHFQQVVELLEARGIPYTYLGPSRYMASLRELISRDRQQALIDTLITGAVVEARSCERFAGLAPRLDEELGRFYRSLLKSEARHYRDYLSLAQELAGGDISRRIGEFMAREAQLVQEPDREFRFHSGTPQSA